MLEGKRAKARRGLLHSLLPRGSRAIRKVIKDPDAQVRGDRDGVSAVPTVRL